MLSRRALIDITRARDRLLSTRASLSCSSSSVLSRWRATHSLDQDRHIATTGRLCVPRCAAINVEDAGQAINGVAPSAALPAVPAAESEPAVYSLEKTQALVATAMFAAVSGLAYVLSTVLKLEASVGYFLPLPVILSALRPNVPAGWRTMVATAILIVVLLGPMRALTYITLHGLLAATLGALWRARVNWWLSISVGAFVRLSGQMAYLLLSSVAMNENFFAIMVANTHGMLDQMAATVGWSGAPSMLVVSCAILGLVLVNSYCYVVLLHVIYRILLQSMGYRLGEMPGAVAKALNLQAREAHAVQRA